MFNPLNPEILELSRQRRMADLLTSQGMQTPQGQTVAGGIYVPPNPMEYIAKLYGTYQGTQANRELDTKEMALARKLRADESAAMADFNKQKQGIPAVEGGIYGPNNQLTTQTTADMYGPNMELNPQYRQVAPVAAIPANPQAAYESLYADPRASARQRDFAFTKMNEGPMKVGVEDTLIDPRTFQPIYTGAGKTSPEILTAAQMLGIRGNPSTWTPQQTAAVNNQVMSLKRAGATNVSVNTANKFAGGFADKASAGAYDMYATALGAPQAIENAKRTIELVNTGALTGPAANIALEAAKIFNVAGANNQDTITKTEQLFSNRGKALLGSVKGSGLAGSQGLTEGERKFLTAAEGGTITLNAETLKAMAGLEIKLAVANQKKWNAQAAKMDPEILRVTGAGPVEVYTGIGTIDTNNPLLKK